MSLRSPDSPGIFGNQLSQQPRPPLVFTVRQPESRRKAKDGYDDGHYL